MASRTEGNRSENLVWGSNIEKDPPDEISIHIFSLLPPHDVANNLTLVSREFKRLSCDEGLWKHFNLTRYPQAKKEDRNTFKETYQLSHNIENKKFSVTTIGLDHFQKKMGVRVTDEMLWIIYDTELYCTKNLDFLTQTNNSNFHEVQELDRTHLNLLNLTSTISPKENGVYFENWVNILRKLESYHQEDNPSEICERIRSELRDLSETIQSRQVPQLIFELGKLQADLVDEKAIAAISRLIDLYICYSGCSAFNLKDIPKKRRTKFVRFSSSNEYRVLYRHYEDREVIHVFNKNGQRIGLLFCDIDHFFPRIHFFEKKIVLIHFPKPNSQKCYATIFDVIPDRLIISDHILISDCCIFLNDLNRITTRVLDSVKISEVHILFYYENFVKIWDVQTNEFYGYICERKILSSYYISSQNRVIFFLKAPRSDQYSLLGYEIEDGKLKKDKLFDVERRFEENLDLGFKHSFFSILYKHNYIWIHCKNGKILRFLLAENEFGKEIEELKLGIDVSDQNPEIQWSENTLVISESSELHLIDFLNL